MGQKAGLGPSQPDGRRRATGAAAKKVALPPTAGVPNTGTATVALKLNDKALTLTLDRANTPFPTNSFLSLSAHV